MLQVGVMGAGDREHADLAEPLGRWLAEIGVNLITGGGKGVMLAVSRGYACVPPLQRMGRIVSIVPGQSDSNTSWTIDFKNAPDDNTLDALGSVKEVPEDISAPAGMPNEYTEVKVQTHLFLSGRCGTHPLSRNSINILSSDAVIALPGGYGTLSEIILARRFNKPVIVYLGEGENCTVTDLDVMDPPVQMARTLDQVKEFITQLLST